MGIGQVFRSRAVFAYPLQVSAWRKPVCESGAPWCAAMTAKQQSICRRSRRRGIRPAAKEAASAKHLLRRGRSAKLLK